MAEYDEIKKQKKLMTVTTNETTRAKTSRMNTEKNSSSTEVTVGKTHLQVKNPLFRFEERPDVLEVLYYDCLSVFADNPNFKLWSGKVKDLTDYTVPATDAEACSYEVKLIHEAMDRPVPALAKKISINRDPRRDREAVVSLLRQASAMNSGVATYETSYASQLGAFLRSALLSKKKMEEQEYKKGVTESVDSA